MRLDLSDAELPAPATTPARQPLPKLVVDEGTRQRALKRLMAETQQAGVAVESLQLHPAAIGGPHPPLVAWRASLALTGPYPAVKQVLANWMQANPSLSLTSLRWQGLRSFSAEASGTQPLATVRLGVELAWLNLPAPAP